MDNRSSVERFETQVAIFFRVILPLAFGPALAIYSYFALPEYLKELGGPRLSDQKTRLSPVAVMRREPVEHIAGWLHISYSPSMQVGHETTFEATYSGDWRRDARLLVGTMTVAVWATSLSLKPEPYDYAFSVERIRFRGSDNRIWTVTADKAGEFNIVVRFVSPIGTGARLVHINGEQLSDNSTSFHLPVKVFSPPRSVWTMLSESANLVGSMVSFLLALPTAGILLTWYLNKKKRRAPKSKPHRGQNLTPP